MMKTMKKCPECGLEVDADAVDCSRCGADLKEEIVNLIDMESIHSSDLDPLRDKIADKYDVVGFLGKGGFSTVFKLKDKILGRFCALKILSKELLAEPEMVERFKNEARLYAKLEHPNIVQVYDVGFYNNVAYILMRYIDGIDLKDYIKQNAPLPLDKVISVSRDIASVLGYMHSKGIVHRDIKPANIMIQKDGRAILTDFGLAKSLDTTKFTATGKILGSPHYLAPEQAKGELVDAKTDVYSLGITMYEMATGKVPFGGETPVQVVIKHIREQMPRPSTINEDIPRSLEKIILKTTKKKPSERFHTMEALVKDLEKLERTTVTETVRIDAPERKRRWMPLLWVVVLMVAVAGLYFSGILAPKEENRSGSQIKGSATAQQVEKKGDDFVAKKSRPSSQKVDSEPAKTPPDTQLKTGEEGQKPLIKSPKKELKPSATTPVRNIAVTIGANARSEVYVDGRLRGQVPPALKIKLAPGKHKLMFIKTNTNKTVIKEVAIHQGQKSFNMMQKFQIHGTITRITAYPWGNVYIDGKAMGMTPVENIRLLEGNHLLRLENPRYQPITKTITIEAGNIVPVLHSKFTQKIDAKKPVVKERVKQDKPQFVTVQLINVLPWGKVFINGKLVGISPVRNIKLAAGEYTIRVENPQFKPYTQKVQLKGGKDIPSIIIRLKERKK